MQHRFPLPEKRAGEGFLAAGQAKSEIAFDLVCIVDAVAAIPIAVEYGARPALKDISFPSCMRAFACICRMCGSSYDGVPHLEDGAFPALMLRRNRSRNAPFPGR